MKNSQMLRQTCLGNSGPFFSIYEEKVIVNLFYDTLSEPRSYSNSIIDNVYSIS